MQVSAANDYRLRDQTLEEVLAAPALQNAERQRKQMQQGVMLVGPGSHHALTVSWSKTVGSFQTEVFSIGCIFHSDAITAANSHPLDLFSPTD